MPTTTPPQPKQRQKPDMRKMLSTRGGSAAVALVSALLAGAILMVFLSRYRDSVDGESKAATVLVAQRLIEKGSSGDVIATEGLYQTARVRRGELKQGAISDPANVRSKVATTDILPGQQLTAKDFAKAGDAVTNKLAGDERAISIPLDGAHGMIGEVKAGDRVDVIAGFNWEQNGTGRAIPVARVLMQNVLVLRAPTGRAGGTATSRGQTKNMVLKIRDTKAAQVAFSAENGKIWIVNRPKAGAKEGDQGIVTLETVLFDSKPIATDRLSADIGRLVQKEADRLAAGGRR